MGDGGAVDGGNRPARRDRHRARALHHQGTDRRHGEVGGQRSWNVSQLVHQDPSSASIDARGRVRYLLARRRLNGRVRARSPRRPGSSRGYPRASRRRPRARRGTRRHRTRRWSCCRSICVRPETSEVACAQTLFFVPPPTAKTPSRLLAGLAIGLEDMVACRRRCPRAARDRCRRACA